MVVQSVLIALVLGALRISTAVGEQPIHDGTPNIVQQPGQPNIQFGFDPYGTGNEGFTLGPQFYSKVDWLPMVTKLSLCKRGQFSDIPASFLELDYMDFSMIVVLPNQGEVLNELHRKLENVNFTRLLSEIELQPTRIYLPKLKLKGLFNPDTKYEDHLEIIKYWNSGTLYNHSNKSLHFNGLTDTFLEINELEGHTLGTFHNGPLWGKYHDGKQEDFRVNRPFIVMILQNNEIILQALIERPRENNYILQKKNLPSTDTTTPNSLTVSYTTEYNKDGTQESSSQLAQEVNSRSGEELAPIETATVDYPETSTTLRYNNTTPTYLLSTGSPAESTWIAEDTTHVKNTTQHPFSTDSSTPTGSPLKYVYTYDGKKGRYNESVTLNDNEPIEITTPNSLTVSYTAENNMNGTQESSSQLAEEVNSRFGEELAPIETATVDYPETSTTLRYNNTTPTYLLSTGSPAESTWIAEDTTHVKNTTQHPFSTDSSTPTGSPLKDVYTYDGKKGRYNESGFINNKSLVVQRISKGILNANRTDAEFANHMDIVKNVLDHAVETSESKSESVKGSRWVEWIYRKFSKKNETEGAKTKSTSEGAESILTIFH